MTTKHTPGPWVAHCTYISGSTDDVSIATCSYRGKVDLAEAEANARLIAAAPEMLEALVSLTRWVAKGIENGAYANTVGGNHLAVKEYDAAVELIKKAKGE